MPILKRCMSFVLAIALILSLGAVPGLAADEKFTVSLVATSDAAGKNEIDSVKAGTEFYIRVLFSGNSEECNVRAFDFTLKYNPELFSVSKSEDFVGLGPCSAAVGNGLKDDGIAFLGWAAISGLYDSENDAIYTEGTLGRLKIKAVDDISKLEISSFSVDVDKTFFSTTSDSDGKIEYNVEELSLPVVVAQSMAIIGDKSEIAAPYYSTPDAEATFSVVLGNDSGELVESPNVTWSISGDSENVTIDNTGKVTVKSGATAGDYTITAKATTASNEGLGDDVTATKVIKVTKEPSLPSRIQSNEPGEDFDTNLKIPADNAADKTVRFSISVWDQYGVEMINPPVTWELDPNNVPGVSLSDDGLLTITNEAKAKITTEGTEFTINASCGGLDPVKTEVTVQRDDPAATSVAIYKGEEVVTSDSIAIPTGDTANKVTYSAKVLDQYGSPMDSSSVTWSSNNLSLIHI